MSAVFAHLYAAMLALGAEPRLPVAVVLEAEGKVERRLRGDFEPPDVVLVAFTWTWPDSLSALLREVTPHHRVVMLVEEGTPTSDARRWLELQDPRVREKVALVDRAVDSPWTRDWGPIHVRGPDGRVLWLDAGYEGRPLDDSATAVIAERLGVAIERSPLPLDGGAMVGNGAGLCVSTVEYFQHNDIDIDDDATRTALHDQLGCPRVVLVPALETEDTKHADLFLQFAAPNRAMLASVDPALAPEDARRLSVVEAALQSTADDAGIDLEIVHVPTPIGHGSEYFSYINELRLRDRFVVASFPHVAAAAQQRAHAALRRAMPGIEIVTVPVVDMQELGGEIHCAALGLTIGKGRRRPA